MCKYLKQIGVAMHNHHDAKGCLPQGTWGGRLAAANWRVFLFPFLEMRSTYDTLRTNGLTSLNNAGSRAILDQKFFSVWGCPSSIAESNPTDSSYNNTTTCNGQQVPAFIGIAGAVDTGTRADPAGRTNRIYPPTGSVTYGYVSDTGMFAVNETIKFGQCIDGLSNTIAVAEQSGVVYPASGGDDGRHRRYSGWFSMGNQVSILQKGDKLSQWSTATLGAADCFDLASLTVVAYANNSRYANAASCPTGGGKNGIDWNTILNSYHPNGIHVLRADASVQFVTDDVDLPTFKKLAARDDQQDARIQ